MARNPDKLSKTLKDFYGEEELVKYFGTPDPSIAQRTKVFNQMWEDFKHELSIDDMDLSVGDHAHLISYLRITLGPFNVVRRGQRLRFRNAEDALFVKMKYMKTSRS